MSARFRRYLITGGAGFIGHRVVRRLLEDGDAAVAVIDNLSVGLPMPPPTAALSAHCIDIRNADAVVACMRAFQPDVVIHLAAVHHIPTCESKRAYALDVNIVGTENILEAAADTDVQRIVLASSGAVYAWSEGPLLEDRAPLDPGDNYALSKYANERQVRFWSDRGNGEAVIARIFNTIGSGDPNAHLLPDIIAQIPQGASEAVVKLGNLSPRRDYIHAEDTARALVAIATRVLPRRLDVFNVSAGDEISVSELVNLLGATMGITIEIQEDPLRRRSVDRPSQLGSTIKIKDEMDFVPQGSLQQALEEIIKHAGWRLGARK